jgi:hypothetical protein
MTSKSRRIGWMRLVARMGKMGNMYRILARKLPKFLDKSKFRNRRN